MKSPFNAIKSIAKEASPLIIPAITLGAAAIQHTTIVHREKSHRSMAFKNEKTSENYHLANAALVDALRWAGVHILHHRMPDANLEPFVELADMYDHPDIQAGINDGSITVPEHMFRMDPAVEQMTLEKAVEIGRHARQDVEGLYQPTENYSKEDIARIFENTKPRYFYESREEMARDRKHPVEYDPENLPTLHQIRFLLRDPHSPVLHRKGMRGVFLDNAVLYAYVEKNLEDPAFLPGGLELTEADVKRRKRRAMSRVGFTALGAAMGVAVGAVKDRSLEPKKVAANAVKGAVGAGVAALTLIGAGGFVNAAGHGGTIRGVYSAAKDIARNKVRLNPDGTYTTNVKGALQQAFRFATADESNQRIHHDKPNLIAYTDEKGAKRWIEASYGSSLQTAVDHDIIFKEGDNYNTDNLDERPDMPNAAVKEIEALRREQFTVAA